MEQWIVLEWKGIIHNAEMHLFYTQSDAIKFIINKITKYMKEETKDNITNSIIQIQKELEQTMIYTGGIGNKTCFKIHHFKNVKQL